MKKFLLPLLILSGLLAEAQPFNNEWINYNNTYYKFKISATALYRISHATLNTVGLGNTPAEYFQLWRNGRQVPIYTSKQTGALGASDYIEFWGERNDGLPDTALYNNLDHQLNRKFSLETDTAAFFLTVNTSGTGARYVPTPNNLPSTIPAEPYHIHTQGVYFREKQNPGHAEVVTEYVHSSVYDAGEGPTSTDLYANQVKTLPFEYLFPYTGSDAPQPVLKINAAGGAVNDRFFQIKANGTVLQNVTMNYFGYVRASVPVPQAIVNTGAVIVEVTNKATIPQDRMVIAQGELVYAKRFHFNGAVTGEFTLPARTNGSYLEITGFTYNGPNPILYDITNRKRYVVDVTDPALLKVLLEPSTTSRNLLLVSMHEYVPQPVTTLQPKTFTNYAIPANQGNFLIITTPALMAGPSGSNPVEDYKAYRSSAAGGNHNAKIYLVEELMDQFAFGIKNNPLGIRNFVRWARATYSESVKNVLLIGKGLSYPQFRTFESYPDIQKLSFVPSFGWPASDNLLTAERGLNEMPKVPIGRISAITPAEVKTYLDKLKQYEQAQAFSSPSIRDRAWLKNVAHVIGASDTVLGNILKNAMDRYKSTIGDTFYGASVHTFSKLSAAAVEQASSTRLKNLFQEGIGVMTYFGHSSSSTLEFNLDNPTEYNNSGKYPVTIVMGCNAGNYFNYNPLRLSTKETLSEKFVLADQRGSIAFLASSHFGIVHYLDIFNTQTYTAASVTQYGKSIGEIMLETIAKVKDYTGTDYYARFHSEQTNLHGDPALKLDGSTPKPDYVIEDQLVKVSPSFISVAETHFRVNAQMMNIGKAINKKIVVEVKRTYPDLRTEVVRRDTIAGIRYLDSLNYSLEIVPTRDKGLNKISICIDADNTVDELYETNNCITKEVFIYENEARPVYPYPFAIVKKADTKLMASTANPYAGMKQYTMEMDTTELFNSPFKISRTINSTGGLLEFTPGVAFTDSTVYYWRVAPVPASGEPTWNKSSFIYLNPAGPNGSDFGFNQSHFYQQTKSKYEQVKVDTASRSTKFDKVLHNLFIRQGTWITSGANNEVSLSVSVDGIPSIRLCCWYSSLVINVFDPISFKAWRNRTLQWADYPTNLGLGLYGSTANQCRSDEERYFNFEYRYTDTAGRRKIMQFLKDTIPDGTYIAVRNFSLHPVYGFPEAFVDRWKADTALYGPGNSLYHLLRNQGFHNLDSFYRTRPFGFVYKKNDPSFTPQILMGEGMYDNPTMSVDCPTPDTIGYVTSPVFGPARAWKAVKWRGSGDATGDKATLDVIGIRVDGSEDILYSGITTLQQNFDISTVSPITYPNIKLKMRTADSINYTPYQLRYWRITYDPVPEGAIAPNIYLKVKDTIEVGEPYVYKVAFKNISDAPFDSLKIKMVITDKNNVPHIIPISKRRPLLVNDTLHIGADINTGTIPGINTVYLEANPDKDQPEQFHFNNFLFRNLYIKPDSLNPLLDVTFDNVHILNGDIVSAKPEIVIKLKDEARWMVLDDTSLLTLQVKYLTGGVTRRYHFNNDTVRFTPAGQAPNTDNTATITFKPHFMEDGEYELIVTGKDKSNNVAGSRNTIEYRVRFEVLNKPMISNMLNYPNPFTSSTSFVFTITGSEVPQNLKIEIMTITGKIVREITKGELGPLHIGRNITQFKWDGTDQFGQKLANGIYLYRVITNLNGRSLDKYTDPKDHKTDKFFNKGYGKMYLMR